MIPKAARARLQNIKISKYLETRRLTEDIFGESGRKPWRGDTPHARDPCQKLKITVISGFRTIIAVVAKYRAKFTVHCRGFWLPYKNYCGNQLPCNNYRALPWWLAAEQSIPWLPITVHQLLCNTVVAAYRVKRYRYEKSLPRKALEKLGLARSIVSAPEMRALGIIISNYRGHPPPSLFPSSSPWIICCIIIIIIITLIDRHYITMQHDRASKQFVPVIIRK